MSLILTEDMYCNIAKIVEKCFCNVSQLEVVEVAIANQFGIPQLTAASIISNLYTRRMMSTHGYVKRNPLELLTKYNEALERGECEGIIIRIAATYGTSPCLAAKVILEEIINQENVQALLKSPNKNSFDQSEDNGDTNSLALNEKKCETPVNSKNFKPRCNQNQTNSSKLMRDTSQIQDPQLAYEVFLCTLSDNQYGNISELYHRVLGEDYERRLYREAVNAGLSFETEKDLRTKGYDKTPDLKLDIPIAVNGFVINWIESKALFGDRRVHSGYISDQYSSYWNRFGPGLVIYWMGFVESIVEPQEKRFLIGHDFPKNITLMKPLSVLSTMETNAWC